MRGHHFLIMLFLAACEGDLGNKTENAAERVQKTADHLRHERRQLAVEVAERADDVATNPERARKKAADHIDDIADEVRDVTREAGELAEAQQDFAYLKSLRIQSLRAEHSVAASQPLLIQVLASARGLLPSAMRRLDENLVIFRQRLAETRDLIEQLQYVSASEWERKDDEVGRAMAAMFIARDASWQALEGKIDDGDYPQT